MRVKYVAAGFRTDMESLIDRFLNFKQEDSQEEGGGGGEKKLCLRFKHFADVWRDSGFSLIFRGRVSENEMQEFIEEMFADLLTQTAPQEPFGRRVAILYMLYSLFVKQPSINSLQVRIRLTFSKYEELKKLVSEAKELEQFDVCFVWYKLLAVGGIEFVAAPRRCGPYYIKNNKITPDHHSATDALLSQFKASIDPQLEDLSHIHDQYRKMKEEQTEQGPSDMRNINNISDNIFEVFKAKLINLQERFKSAPTTNEAEQNNFQMDPYFEDEESQQEEQEDIGSRRRKIKNKAMKNSTASGASKKSKRPKPNESLENT